MVNLLPNLKFNVCFWKHCIIETQVSLMLINTAAKPNLLWFMQIITLLNKSKNSFYLSHISEMVWWHLHLEGIFCNCTGKSLARWRSAVWCRLRDGCNAKLNRQPAKGQRNFHSLSALCFCRRWNMLWCLVLSVADLKEKVEQNLHLPRLFSIAVGWPLSPKMFSSWNTSWRKVLCPFKFLFGEGEGNLLSTSISLATFDLNSSQHDLFSHFAKTTSFKWRSIWPRICLNSSSRSEYLRRSRIGDFKEASKQAYHNQWTTSRLP